MSKLAFGILSDVKKQESTASDRLFSDDSVFDGDVVKGKAAFSGVLTVLLEAAKQDSTAEQVKSVFEDLESTQAELLPSRKGSSNTRSKYALG